MAKPRTTPKTSTAKTVSMWVATAEPATDVPGTLYIDCLFRPSSPRSELTDELYAWARSVAIPAAIQRGSGSRVTWAPDDEIVAARVVTAGIPPAGSGVQ